MNNDPSGGAAFPSPGVVLGEPALGQHQQGAYEGMTLRDWFAGNFMKRAHVLCETGEGWGYADAAECAYEMADAMLKARQA